jgi:hypothetical protein
MFNLCAPALIYVAFSLTQIIIDTFKGLYNTAFLKIIVMVIITILLNTLCQSGMGIISWVIVFIPFIFMSVIVAILLYVFGLDPETGTLNVNCDNKQPKKGNLIFSSSSPPSKKNVKFVDVTYSDTPLDTNEISEHLLNDHQVPDWSSDPQYE